MAVHAEQYDSWSNFWTLCRIEPSANGAGYLNQPLSSAQSFLRQGHLLSFAGEDNSSGEQLLCVELLEAFRNPQECELSVQALSGLCLRCWVSHPILTTCMKLANLFGASGQFGYRDLLPFVLTDDSRQLMIVEDKRVEEDGSKKTKPNGWQFLRADGQTVPLPYVSFSLTILQTYRLASERRLSLANWARLQTKQHPELINFLADFGFQKLSDWALLNRVRTGQLKQLSARDCSIVVAFHAVYRRDRRLSGQLGRCSNPTEAQLEEMSHMLSELAIASSDLLLRSLKQIALQLRQFDVWRSRESLERFDAAEGEYRPRSDLPTAGTQTVTKEEELAEEALIATLHEHLAVALVESLQTALCDRITKLNKSKKYRPFANKFGAGLQAYYREGLSLKEITPLLGTSSWDQTRRILNPGNLLNQVRSLTLQTFSFRVLETIEQKSLAPWPPTPDYLQQLVEQLEHFADAELFQAAVAEMKAGSHRNLNSAYAQQLLLALNKLDSSTA
ncbi:MAG: hypothetical protein AAGL17_00295 [Cyanobacteria bacterium J06576_12]